MKSAFRIFWALLFFFILSTSYQGLSQHFCNNFIDNNIATLSFETDENRSNFRFIGYNLKGTSISFVYQGQRVSLPEYGSVSGWFAGQQPNKASLDCSSVRIDGYELRSIEHMFYTYFHEYNQLPTCDYNNVDETIKIRLEAIRYMEELKNKIPTAFHEELNFRIHQSESIIACSRRALSNTKDSAAQQEVESSSSSTRTSISSSGNKGQEVQGQAEYDELMQRLEDDRARNQISERDIQGAIEGIAGVTSAISDGISDFLVRKKAKRASSYWTDFDEMAAIGYYGSSSSALGMEVDDINPLGWGWGITMRVNPVALFTNRDSTPSGDYTTHNVHDSWGHKLVHENRKSSFSIGAHVNRGITHFMFLQVGIGFGGMYNYKVYEVTDVGGYDVFEDEIGKRYWYRKSAEKTLGLTSECALLFKLKNVCALKGGLAFHNFKQPQAVFGLLFMPDF